MNTPTSSPTPDRPDTPDLPDRPSSPETRADDTLADEVFVDDTRTAPLPTAVAPTATATPVATAGGASMTTTAPAVASTPSPPTPAEPEWLSGPAPFALVLGVLGLLVAGSTLVSELTDVSLPWGDLGPWSVVAAGLVVLLVGAIGLRSSRNRG